MEENSRLKNSSYNVLFNIIQLIITTILSFLTRTIFIKYLGKEILGLDGLFTSIISMLSLSELGIGTAISYSLYKPISNKNNQKISCLMSLYKRIYLIIGIAVFIIGIIIIPLLPFFTNGYTYSNLNLIYLLYLISAASSYFVIYKELILIASQKGYKVFWIRAVFITLLYSIEILLLINFSNFLYYLIANVIIRFFENVAINIYVGKKYKNIDFNSKLRIDSKTKAEIKNNIKNLFLGKVGDYLLNGTDNIIISSINIGLTGIYSNYLSIVSIMKTIMVSIYNGVTSSFGNLVATESKSVQENVFNISNYACFLISGFITLELIFLFNPFITIWIGKEYVISFWIVIIIGLNYYFYCQLLSLDSMKNAAGKYRIDKYVPLIQAFINLAFSIFLGKIMGIGGVIFGTLISYLLVGCIAKPYLVYKYIFNKSAKKYYLLQLKYFAIIIFNYLIMNSIFSRALLNNNILNLISKFLIIFIIYLVIILIIFRNDDKFKYLFENFKQIFRRKNGLNYKKSNKHDN
jgi:O-antigen/teichoic acid export membrane protein